MNIECFRNWEKSSQIHSLGFVCNCPDIESLNLRSNFICPDIINEEILDEVKSESVLGAFDSNPFADMQCSPLGFR